MEHGFFHPDRGYWQTTGDVPDYILATYPDGTVEVPIKPSADHEWNGTEWVQVLPDPAEVGAKLAADARADRDTKLAQSDWTQLTDAPVDRAAWADYRQALRDVTDQMGFPEVIDWPVPPTI